MPNSDNPNDPKTPKAIPGLNPKVREVFGRVNLRLGAKYGDLDQFASARAELKRLGMTEEQLDRFAQRERDNNADPSTIPPPAQPPEAARIDTAKEPEKIGAPQLFTPQAISDRKQISWVEKVKTAFALILYVLPTVSVLGFFLYLNLRSEPENDARLGECTALELGHERLIAMIVSVREDLVHDTVPEKLYGLANLQIDLIKIAQEQLQAYDESCGTVTDDKKSAFKEEHDRALAARNLAVERARGARK